MAENSKILLCHSFNSLSKISNFIMALDTKFVFLWKKKYVHLLVVALILEV
jgi:hypothetical protein